MASIVPPPPPCVDTAEYAADCPGWQSYCGEGEMNEYCPKTCDSCPGSLDVVTGFSLFVQSATFLNCNSSTGQCVGCVYMAGLRYTGVLVDIAIPCERFQDHVAAGVGLCAGCCCAKQYHSYLCQGLERSQSPCLMVPKIALSKCATYTCLRYSIPPCANTLLCTPNVLPEFSIRICPYDPGLSAWESQRVEFPSPWAALCNPTIWPRHRTGLRHPSDTHLTPI